MDNEKPMRPVDKRRAQNGGTHPGGRPPHDASTLLRLRSIRMTDGQWDKVNRNGGAEWLRGLIDKAKDKEKPGAGSSD